MTPVPGIWRGRAVPCVTCRDVTCRACDVARDRSIGPDLGEEKPVAKANPAKNPPRPFGRVLVSMGHRAFIKREQVVTF